MGKLFSLFNRLQMDKLCCYFVNKPTNDNLIFPRWANCKQIKKIAWPSVSIWCLHVSMSPSPCHYVYLWSNVSGIPQTENGTYGKRQLPFVFCKRKTETANSRLFVANGKRTVVCLGWQTINGDRKIAVLAYVPSNGSWSTIIIFYEMRTVLIKWKCRCLSTIHRFYNYTSSWVSLSVLK
jgi:hypothetical protein